MSQDLEVARDGHVSIVELRRGPHNFVDRLLLAELADALGQADADPDVRAILLTTQGKNFCAGANFNDGPTAAGQALDATPFYQEAMRLFGCTKPIVAAVQGSAVGAGLGLALVADFRVATPDTRFSANFNRLGIHPGFGLTVTLPRIIGAQRTARLFYTGGALDGAEAASLDLVDLLVPSDDLRSSALEFAKEIACSAPLAVAATRDTLRDGLVEVVGNAMRVEAAAQKKQFVSADFKEGVAAAKERRMPAFLGR